MIRCEVINQEVTIKEWKRLSNIKRIKNSSEIVEPNRFDIGDTFETDEDFASYLSGETKEQPIVCVRVLEIIPEYTKDPMAKKVKIQAVKLKKEKVKKSSKIDNK